MEGEWTEAGCCWDAQEELHARISRHLGNCNVSPVFAVGGGRHSVFGQLLKPLEGWGGGNVKGL